MEKKISFTHSSLAPPLENLLRGPCRGDVYIIKGHRNLTAFISLLLISKVVYSEDHFSEEGLFGSRFSKWSFKFTGKWKGRVSSHASASKYQANKNYANLGFILLQVTKGFRFQKNKNVRFIFSSERFLWKVKTIRGGLYILINKHLQYQCFRIYHTETHVTNIC